MQNTSLGRFRLIALLEGISFLVLLGIAMPLKYFAGMPMAVKIVGMAHGVLFLLYIALLADVAIKYKWGVKKIFLALIASVLPFGTMVFDAKVLKKESDLGS